MTPLFLEKKNASSSKHNYRLPHTTEKLFLSYFHCRFSGKYYSRSMNFEVIFRFELTLWSPRSYQSLTESRNILPFNEIRRFITMLTFSPIDFNVNVHVCARKNWDNYISRPIIEPETFQIINKRVSHSTANFNNTALKYRPPFSLC